MTVLRHSNSRKGPGGHILRTLFNTWAGAVHILSEEEQAGLADHTVVYAARWAVKVLCAGDWHSGRAGWTGKRVGNGTRRSKKNDYRACVSENE